MNRIDLAVSFYNKGGNCSQAVLAAYSEQFGFSCDKAFSLGAGFGGGMRMGRTCGAVTGAFMVLGLKNGAAGPEDKEAKDKTYEMVKEFTKRFTSRNGSVSCKELLGCDITSEEGMKIANEKDLFSTLCPKLVREAAEIIEEMLF